MRLRSRDPELFWTSGQWMTERRGGSDVADGTETVAVPQADGTYRLYGYKWFSSATDADMTLTLARIIDDDENIPKGTRGVSMFYVEIRNPDGSLNGIEIQTLKNKLGTRQVPTAELLLDGAKAHLISEPGRGIAGITPMLTVTRIYNSVGAVSAMRRILQLSRDYSLKRSAFGKKIIDHPLHVQTLARMETETRGGQVLVLHVAHLLGLQENNQQTEEEELLLRLLTPVMKLYTAKQSISTVSEGLESFGGQGYIEDTGLPAILRDAQVTSIWEGTTNVLSLDVLRSVIKTQGGTLSAYFTKVDATLSQQLHSDNPDIQSCTSKLVNASRELQRFVQSAVSRDPGFLEVAARDFAFSLARVYIGMLLVEHASWEHATEYDIITAKRWCEKDLCLVVTNECAGHYTEASIQLNRSIVLSGKPEWT